MAVDLTKLNDKLDEALNKETTESLNEFLDKHQSEDNKWKPKVGERYYYFDRRLRINWTLYCGIQANLTDLETGNMFQTEEEATNVVNQIKNILKR